MEGSDVAETANRLCAPATVADHDNGQEDQIAAARAVTYLFLLYTGRLHRDDHCKV